MVPAPSPPMKYHWQGHGTFAKKRSEGRVVGEPEELMKEGNIVILRDYLLGARRTLAACRPCTAHLDPH